LGVAALEDKIVQQAVVTILNQIYEEDFLGFSYGFRPGRSQHDALDALSYALLKKKVSPACARQLQLHVSYLTGSHIEVVVTSCNCRRYDFTVDGNQQACMENLRRGRNPSGSAGEP
jgi:hypothetical protein